MLNKRYMLAALGLLIGATSYAQQEPALLDKPAIGATIEGIRFHDVRFLERSLDEFGDDAKAYVLMFTSTTCPLVQRYLPKVEQLHQEFEDKGVVFIGVNVMPGEGILDVGEQWLEYELTFHLAKDFYSRAADAVGATRTPEVVVLDKDMRLRYRGRVDDQYRLGGARPEASEHNLRDAIEAVLAGRGPNVAETPVDGCKIMKPVLKKPEVELTYSEHIAPILNKHCVECHRDGTAAPFALDSYRMVSRKAGIVAEVVELERMPPWFAADGYPITNHPTITDEERLRIVQWADLGAPPGDLAAAPEPPQFGTAEWQMGTPDFVTTEGEEFEVPATGSVEYHYVFLPDVFEEERWVQGIEIKPSNPRVVHHANLVYVEGGNFIVDQNFLSGLVPGGGPMILKDGVALRLPANVLLALQVHYVTTGKPEKIRMSVGFKFAKETVRRELHYRLMSAKGFKIAPHDPMYRIAKDRTLPHDAEIYGLFSHMHLRGRDTTFWAHLPNGDSKRLLSIPAYNFDWQLGYEYEPGHILPEGTRVETVGHFDNSAFNPYNPDPSRAVPRGDQTEDEMMDGFIFFTVPDENLNLEVDPNTGIALGALADAERAEESTAKK